MRTSPGLAGEVVASPAAPTLWARLRPWLGIFSAYFSAQGMVQLLGVTAGLLLVRNMPVREFALYTLASSAIAFFTLASDLGSSTSLVHFFRRAAEEGESFDRYLAAVRSLRRAAFLAGAAGVLLLFPRAAAAQGFGAAETWLAALCILLAVHFQIGASLGVLALRLRDRYGLSYRAEVAGGAVRLASALAMVATDALRGWIGTLSAALAAGAVAGLARQKDGSKGADGTAPPAADLAPYRRAVLRYLLPTLPSALYFAVQAPLAVWLAATFGSARNVAEVGALGRLGLVVGLFSGLTGTVFLPRLARIADEQAWRRRCLQFGALLTALALSLLAATALAPGLLLAVLGEQYGGLRSELLLVIGASGLALVDGYLAAVNLARSWTRWQGLAVASLALAQVALAALLPLGTTAGVLWFNLGSAGAALVGQGAIAALGFSRPSWVHWR